MRAVVQRVSCAQVRVEGALQAEIGRGLLVLVAVLTGDTDADRAYIANKIGGLRIFRDETDKMNLSVKDVCGEILLVSQFTLAGDVRRGKRPSFILSAEPKLAQGMIKELADELKAMNIPTCTGVFGADMQVTLSNEGPVTILLDSGRLF